MSPLSVLIADDEAPARAKVRRYLATDARFALAGEARDGREAVERAHQLHPDLLVLDVQMPGLDGFEVLESLGADACPKVIFSTAYDVYAVRAFDAAALDYLLKPYDAPRFRKALDRAYAQLAAGATDAAALQGLLEQPQHTRPLTRILVREGEAWLPLELAQVQRISARDKYVSLYVNGREHRSRTTMSSLAQRLDPVRFVRVHRSEIVNLEAIERVEPYSHGDALLVLKDGTCVVLSRNHREEFMRRFGAS